MKNSKIVRWGVASLVMLTVLLYSLIYVYNLDTDYFNVSVLKQFMRNESDVIFDGIDCYEAEGANSLQSLLVKLKAVRVEIEIGYMSDYLQEERYYLVVDPSEWRSLYDSLVPDSITYQSNFVTRTIKAFAIFDCIMCMDVDREDYWYYRCEALSELRKYEPYLGGFEAFIIGYSDVIVTSIAALTVLLFVVNCFIIYRYVKGIKSMRNSENSSYLTAYTNDKE